MGYYTTSGLRSLKYVDRLLATERNQELLKKLRYEKRLIIIDDFLNNIIDFESFKQKIEEIKK